MSLYTLVLTIYFSIIGLLTDISGEIKNPILCFYNLQFDFIRKNLVFFVLMLFTGTIYFFIKANRIRMTFSVYLQNIVVATMVSSFFSIIILFLIAFLQLNIIALLIGVKPNLLGIESDIETIVETLENRSSPPSVVVGNERENSVISAIALAQSGGKSYYGNEIVKNIPSFLVIGPKEIDISAFLVGNTLIIVRANSVDFQSISSAMSYLFIKDYFPNQNIDCCPKVSLMDQEEYQKYREEDFQEKIRVLGDVIYDIDESISDLNNSISRLEKKITDDKVNLEQLRKIREGQYISCVNEGYYEEDGEYIKTNTKDECKEEILLLDEEVSDLRESIDEGGLTIEKNKEKLKQYEAYSKYYAGQKTVTDEMTQFISYEFASFETPENIRIALFENNKQSVADYFELLIHEYLHYTTFNETGERLATDFFREGLTEYFARKIIKRNLGIDTNLGYPANVKIIQSMSESISDSDFANVYFSQDEQELEKVLDLVYGEGFYKRNRVLLETLHYSSSSQNILELSNSVIEEIGGDFLTKEDLKTTYSTFR